MHAWYFFKMHYVHCRDEIYRPMGLNNGPCLLLWTGGIGCSYEPRGQSGGGHRSRSDSTETRNTLILDFSSGGSHHRFIPASRESKSVPCPHFTQEIRSHPIRRERERDLPPFSQALLRSAAASPAGVDPRYLPFPSSWSSSRYLCVFFFPLPLSLFSVLGFLLLFIIYANIWIVSDLWIFLTSLLLLVMTMHRSECIYVHRSERSSSIGVAVYFREVDVWIRQFLNIRFQFSLWIWRAQQATWLNNKRDCI